MAKLQFLDVFEKATEQDLTDLRKQIVEAQKRLDAMQAAEKVLALKLHGKPPRAARAPKATKLKLGETIAKGEQPAGRGKTEQHRIKAAEYLIHIGTAVKPTTLAEAIGCPIGSITAILDHAWFEKTPDGVRLTAEGKRMVG